MLVGRKESEVWREIEAEVSDDESEVFEPHYQHRRGSARSVKERCFGQEAKRAEKKAEEIGN